ncbi:hypothetical protein BX600DRAFT_259266 [Xylariales sp. PMI_506]|nr:hypothetical protein BX600DRAFT_259266 [Xylariales sp. PMI_506]
MPESDLATAFSLPPRQTDVSLSNWTSVPGQAEVSQVPPSMMSHGRLVFASPHTCAQCSETCQVESDLRRHGEQEGHRPYACFCGIFFKRLDALKRHVGSGGPSNKCDLCDSSFGRRDHLLQHLRAFHKVNESCIRRYRVRGGRNASA